ncbi:MAG: multidrug resistance efflux pump [Saprospiraceae bacterium]|jgi:multidrug resistance efflux pump|tara:strand:+ start:3564 stop:4946 length:1383 start_codon:yes stop_codon:yes gene_type:complete
MKKSIIYGLIAVVVAASVYFMLRPDSSSSKVDIFAQVKKSNFVVAVNATGELKAKKSIKIRGPQGMRSAGIYNTTIKDLIPEGTVVKKGEYVASLDKTELATKITGVQTDIEKEMTKLEQIKIDTAIQMKGVRDESANMLFSMAQERLEIERNKYEPQMVIEQSELKLRNSERSMDQLKGKTELMVIQSDAKVREIQANLKQLDSKLKQMTDVAASFMIMAPEDGMLIYERSWNGKKGPGSQISAWDPTVAELPDLTNMTSVAYINEIDISKIRKGQQVSVKVDAFPEKIFDGQIISVANIGQELRGQEAKVFEIVIAINQVDDVLKPSMTTTNEIMIYEYEDVVNIPLEAFYSDSIDYVFVKRTGKVVRQQIISGASNENDIIVVEGLSLDDKVMLTAPDNVEEVPYEFLSKDIADSGTNKLESWKKNKATYDKTNEEIVKGEEDQNKNMGGGEMMIMF